MDDFISMMGYRETTIQRIIDRIRYESNADVETICREEGIPISDLTYSEQQRIVKELNYR